MISVDHYVRTYQHIFKEVALTSRPTCFALQHTLALCRCIFCSTRTCICSLHLGSASDYGCMFSSIHYQATLEISDIRLQSRAVFNTVRCQLDPGTWVNVFSLVNSGSEMLHLAKHSLSNDGFTSCTELTWSTRA